MAVLTHPQTPSFPTATEGYDRAAVDAAFEAERAWRRELEDRAALLLREAAALHLAIATHTADRSEDPALQVAIEVERLAVEAATVEEPTADQAEDKRRAAAERRKAAAAAKKEAALAEELKARQAEEKRRAAAERRKAAAAAKQAAAAEQDHDAVARAVREEIARATAEVTAMKQELERMKALHGELPAPREQQPAAVTVPAQAESVRTVPPAAAAFAVSAGSAWARRTSESTTVRRTETDGAKPRPATAAPAAVTVPLIPMALPVVEEIEQPGQDVPAARNGNRFSSKRIVLRKPAAPLEDIEAGRVESRVIRLG